MYIAQLSSTKCCRSYIGCLPLLGPPEDHHGKWVGMQGGAGS